MEYYQVDIKEVYSELKSDENGLSTEQAKQRLAEYGTNEIKEGKKITPLRIFINQFKDVIIWILIIATVISGFLGEYVDAIVIGIILVLNSMWNYELKYYAKDLYIDCFCSD